MTVRELIDKLKKVPEELSRIPVKIQLDATTYTSSDGTSSDGTSFDETIVREVECVAIETTKKGKGKVKHTLLIYDSSTFSGGEKL